MNTAEAKRKARIAAMDDHDVLDAALSDDNELSPGYREMIKSFKLQIQRGQRLSKRQRQIAEECAAQVIPLDSREVPKGKPVETPAVLKNLPLKPPGRR